MLSAGDSRYSHYSCHAILPETNRWGVSPVAVLSDPAVIGISVTAVNQNIHFNSETIISSGSPGKFFSGDLLIFIMKKTFYIVFLYI